VKARTPFFSGTGTYGTTKGVTGVNKKNKKDSDTNSVARHRYLPLKKKDKRKLENFGRNQSIANDSREEFAHSTF
jgi:hypothetical protein